MADSLRPLLLSILDESYDRKAWHGPTLRGALRGVNANQAFWKPAPERHSIWDFVLHCAYWKFVARRRLLGARGLAFPRPGRDWFAVPEPSDRAWRADMRLLQAEHRELREAIEDAPAKLIKRRSRELRSVAAHDVYHAGQVQLMKRLYGL